VSNDTVDPINNTDLAALINALRAEVRGLASRVATLEQGHGGGGAAAAAAAGPAAMSAAMSATTPAATSTTTTAAPPATAPAAPPAKQPEATEDDLLVIAAAVAAYLGVRARIRQVRLIQSTAWAQVGRATVHASHRVH
jgi:methylmalonyl-CoA carboxyltransferase large subunit